MSRGDHLIVGRGLYTHHGIDLGDGSVVHYSGLADGLRAGPVERVSMEEFCGGEVPRLRRHDKAKFALEQAARRAEDRVGEDRYNLVWCNCESFCEWAHTGRQWSPQIVAVGAVGALAAAGLAAAGFRGASTRQLLAPAMVCIGAVIAAPQVSSRLGSTGRRIAVGRLGTLSFPGAA